MRTFSNNNNTKKFLINNNTTWKQQANLSKFGILKPTFIFIWNINLK